MAKNVLTKCDHKKKMCSQKMYSQNVFTKMFTRMNITLRNIFFVKTYNIFFVKLFTVLRVTMVLLYGSVIPVVFHHVINDGIL